MRVVFDTNVLVRGAMSPGGPAGAALQAVLEQREHEFITSTWLLQEVEDVLQRPRLRQYHQFDDERIRTIILDFDRVATRVVIGDPPPTPLVKRDPNDDSVILTAIAGEADIICTRDADLLDADTRQFCGQRGIRLMTDIELLAELRLALTAPASEDCLPPEVKLCRPAQPVARMTAWAMFPQMSQTGTMNVRSCSGACGQLPGSCSGPSPCSSYRFLLSACGTL